MRKIKLISAFFGILLGFGLAAEPVFAVSPTIAIQVLPEYINYQDFKLSYSAISGDPASIQIQFYSNKDGGSYSSFGAVQSGASGQVNVTSSQIGESGKKYCFKAEIVGEGASNETCTTFDNSGPDAPGSFSKERLGPSTIRIKWHTPNNDDFSQVYVYRSDNPDFSADDSHFVYAQGGDKDKDMEWTDNGIDANKDYYYLMRALDKAGNSSGLVGDVYTVYASASPTPVLQTNDGGQTVILPKEGTEGEVLGNETEEQPQESPEVIPTEEPAGVLGDAVQFAKDKTKLTVGIVAGIIIIGFLIYRQLKAKGFSKK